MFGWIRRRRRPSEATQSIIAEKPDLVDLQLNLLDRSQPITIIDAYTSQGWWSEQYLTRSPQSRIIAIEPDEDNFAKATARLSRFGDRAELIHGTLVAPVRVAVADQMSGACQSAKAAEREEPASPPVPGAANSFVMDAICAERAIDTVDILKMEIGGLDFEALTGAEGLLKRGAIRLIMIKVAFSPRPGEMPIFGTVSDYLRRFGYELQGIYEGYRDPPTVLRQAEAVFVRSQSAPAAPVVLMLNETIESVEGRRLPDRFLGVAHLREGASIRDQSPSGQSGSVSDRELPDAIETASILNTIIDTSTESYRYSLLLEADKEIRRRFKKSETVTAEVAILAISGKVGIMWVDEQYQSLNAEERHVSPMRGVQRVLVSAPAARAWALVLRNMTGDSERATFRVSEVKAKVADASSPRGPAHSKADMLYLQGHAKERSGDREGAARLFADAVTSAPDHAPALEGQGELLDLAGKTDSAAGKYSAARQLRAQHREGPPDRSLVVRRRGPFTDQVAAFSSVLQVVKHGTLPYVARGNSFLSEGRADAALRDYEDALALKSSLPEIMALKGEALAMLGCYREALQAFDSAVAERPQDPEILSGRAIALLAIGDLKGADADWRRQLELLAPSRASARACVALRLADYELAAVELERALAKEPHDAYWRLYHMTALRRLGRPVVSADLTATNGWAGRLIRLQAGQLSGDEVMKEADSSGRRAEALFQLGVLASSQNGVDAARLWKEVVMRSGPDMIEHAAARHELARLRA